jgi:hypothetical protein
VALLSAGKPGFPLDPIAARERAAAMCSLADVLVRIADYRSTPARTANAELTPANHQNHCRCLSNLVA